MERKRTSRHQRHRSSSERTQIAGQFEGSGLTLRDFAGRHGYALSSLTRWVAESRRLRRSEPPVVFSEVKISPPFSPSPGTAWAVELIGPDGMTIRLRDELSMRDLLELLRGKPC